MKVEGINDFVHITTDGRIHIIDPNVIHSIEVVSFRDNESTIYIRYGYGCSDQGMTEDFYVTETFKFYGANAEAEKMKNVLMEVMHNCKMYRRNIYMGIHNEVGNGNR